MIQPERRTYSLSSRVYIWLDLHRVSRNGETTKNEHSADALDHFLVALISYQVHFIYSNFMIHG